MQLEGTIEVNAGQFRLLRANCGHLMSTFGQPCQWEVTWANAVKLLLIEAQQGQPGPIRTNLVKSGQSVTVWDNHDQSELTEVN